MKVPFVERIVKSYGKYTVAPRVADFVVPYLIPGESVLDVGSGEGWVAHEIVRKT